MLLLESYMLTTCNGHHMIYVIIQHFCYCCLQPLMKFDEDIFNCAAVSKLWQFRSFHSIIASVLSAVNEHLATDRGGYV